MARLYSNENFPQPAVLELRRLGHDVRSVVDGPHAGQALSDEAVLRLAAEDGRAVLTLNRRHFVRLHAVTRGAHLGIVVCSVDPDFTRLARRVSSAVEGEDLSGKLMRVNRGE